MQTVHHTDTDTNTHTHTDDKKMTFSIDKKVPKTVKFFYISWQEISHFVLKEPMSKSLPTPD